MLQKDTGNAKYSGLLEKKWTSVLRLQKKVTPFVTMGCVDDNGSTWT